MQVGGPWNPWVRIGIGWQNDSTMILMVLMAQLLHVPVMIAVAGLTVACQSLTATLLIMLDTVQCPIFWFENLPRSSVKILSEDCERWPLFCATHRVHGSPSCSSCSVLLARLQP